MSERISVFTELFALGYNPIPIIWDGNKPVGYPEHVTDATGGKPNIEDVKRWLNNGFKDFNGIALKLFPPYGMFDFDLKNTTNKNLYKDWLQIINSTNPDILSKVCIESTKSGGYHVYVKHPKLDHKIPIARSPEGSETISLYTGGLLSFCYPSPNYALIHNEFSDVQELTNDELDLLINTAAIFNECEEHKVGENKIAVIDYPVEYENVCLQFDSKITDDAFDTLLNSIDLYEVKKKTYKNKKWIAYLRQGSSAEYSAKVYFKSRRVLLFSASMHKFPTWHDSAKMGDKTWSLSPSKIVFYKNNKNWTDAISEIKMICESIGIEIIEPDITEQKLIPEDRLKFPYDVFPEAIQNYINAHAIQPEYTANFMLTAVATALGNSAVLEAMTGYYVKPVFYLACIAHSGGGKSPGMKAAFKEIHNYDKILYESYKKQLSVYDDELALFEKDKKKTERPKKPNYPQMLINDSTIEKVAAILSVNPNGCCVYADELSGFISRMNQYKNGDDVQKWLELWSGGSILLQRMSREETRVEDPFCCIAGGIQPAIIDLLAKGENEHNGFYQRFLFAYPEQQPKSEWQQVIIHPIILSDFHHLFNDYIVAREKFKSIYHLSAKANEMYAAWFNYKNIQYNKATSDHIKGIISKYQNYCLRFALLCQCMHERQQRTHFIDEVNMERAIRLTEHYLGMMNKVTKLLVPESPIDKLQEHYAALYHSLPEMFTIKVAQETGKTHGLKDNSVKTFVIRNTGKIFKLVERGTYEKIY